MESSRLLPIIVQFGVGAVLCGVAIWGGLRSGYLDLTVREDRRLLGAFVGGFIGLLVLYLLFTYVAPYWPAEGTR